MDEVFHYPEIMRFASGNFQHTSQIAMGPGYHFVMALPTWIFRLGTVASVRFLEILVSAGFLLLFYRLARQLDPAHASMKLLQVSLYPLLFPYYFILFTDIMTTLFVLLCFYFVLSRRYTLAGLVGSLSLVVRQSSVVWLVLFLVFAYIQEHGKRLPTRQSLMNFFPKSATFLLGIVGFLIFVIINGGVVLGGSKLYMPFVISFGNAYIILFLLFLFHLPEHILFAGRITRSVHKHWKIVLLGAILWYVFYLATFTNTHPWNQTPYFLRNQLMHLFTKDLVWKTVLFIIALYELFVILAHRFVKPRYALIHIAGIIPMVSMWLIEPRYAVPYVTLFLLLRTIESIPATYASIVLSLSLSLYQVWGLHFDRFFP